MSALNNSNTSAHSNSTGTNNPAASTGGTPVRETPARASSRSEESSASLRSSSHNQKSLNFFRSIMGHRNIDYRSDAPQQEGNLFRGISVRSIGRSREPSGNPIHDVDTEIKSSFWNRWYGRCFGGKAAQARRNVGTAMLNNMLWKVLLCFFTILLLFGAQVRDLWLPSSSDTTMDVLNMIALCFFTIDIIIRVDVEPNYFNFKICQRDRSENSNRQGCAEFSIGSFIFWCEVVSTLALLHEISFIDKGNFSETVYHIQLDPFGIPINGLQNVNKASPVEAEVSLLTTIAKTARVARFIRSSTAVKISSKVNWYKLANIFDPCWWWLLCRRRTKMPTEQSERVSTKQPPNDVSRRTSWGSLANLAAAKAKAYEEQQNKPKRSVIASVLRPFKVRSRGGQDNDELRRQWAASKIQRAWRRVLAQRNHHYEENYSDRSDNDFAWKGRYGNNAGELRQTKRSFLFHGKGRYHNDAVVVSERQPSRSGVTRRRNESQVGSAMRELTGQRVAVGILVALVLTVLFTYTEVDTTRPETMIVLHNQTAVDAFANKSLNAARSSSIPDLYWYQLANNEIRMYTVPGEETQDLRPHEKLFITVTGFDGSQTAGLFAYKNESQESALVILLATLFIILIWIIGVTAFAGPVMILVVHPVERMVRLLGMLMLDPLGYQSTARFKRFMTEEDEITKNTRWTKEVLKGMETSFLMSTILRIGSLMKVGFGSAGVEIIRNNLEKGQNKNMLMLNSQGSTVSCIFLFCDIRNFTDATECLQEEVFVFTNRIAGVVHSICHSYGGSANKNVGDAFLLSWLLEEDAHGSPGTFGSHSGEDFVAKHNQADKALLSVVKICMALHHDEYYIETMSDAARDALLSKLSRRKGPIVQMGLGLHAGKAVQGAIGSQRKIDATYVSEAVERAEFLESSTKKYGVKMLMSDNFHRLLHPSNRRRCRKIDQILIHDDDDDDDDGYPSGDIVELLTFDMDIDALWKTASKTGKSEGGHESDSESGGEKNSSSKRDLIRAQHGLRQGSANMLKGSGRRRSLRVAQGGSDELNDSTTVSGPNQNASQDAGGDNNDGKGTPELILPSGPALYNANVWVSEDMRKIRQLYSDGLFFQKFNSGLQSYYAKDWEHAKQCFVTILDRFEDGPSRYFLTQIEKQNGVPPRDFLGYGVA